MMTTGFGLKTTEPKTKVKLGVGVHKLALTVVDDANMASSQIGCGDGRACRLATGEPHRSPTAGDTAESSM